jgi:phage-related protein
MASIYNILEWDDAKAYGTHDIVKYGGYFYYSLQPNNSNHQPEIGSVYWNGVVNVGSKSWPYFFWDASYNTSIDSEPKVLSIQFGDGYEQRMADGLNHDLVKFSLSFERRNKQESVAIAHFLSARQGYKAFYYRAPEPYGVLKKFVSASWSSQINFDNNYTINAEFKEIS